MRKPRPKSAPVSRVLDSFAEFDGDKQFATTLARGLEILRCFTPEGPILGNKDLAERTSLPKPTVSRFTYTLSRLGYLKADHISSKYQLGPAVLAIGYPLLATMSLRQLARPAMKELADYAGGSVSMGIRDRSISSMWRPAAAIRCSRASSPTSACRSRSLRPPSAAPISRPARRRIAKRSATRSGSRRRRTGSDTTARSSRASSDFERYGFCLSWGDLRRDVHAVGVPLRRLGERRDRGVQLRAAILSGEAGSDQIRYRAAACRDGARTRGGVIANSEIAFRISKQPLPPS